MHRVGEKGKTGLVAGYHGGGAAGMAVGARRAGDHRPMLHPDRVAHLVGTGGVRVESGRASGGADRAASRRSCITPASTRPSACGKARTTPTAATPRWAACADSARDADGVVRRTQRPRPVLLRRRHRRRIARQAAIVGQRALVLRPDHRRQRAARLSVSLSDSGPTISSDLAAVRAGKKDPWEVRPYGVWPFERADA